MSTYMYMCTTHKLIWSQLQYHSKNIYCIYDPISSIKYQNALHNVDERICKSSICLPSKLAVLRVNGKTENAKMDFIKNKPPHFCLRLCLKNDGTYPSYINGNLNFNLLIFKENIFFCC